MHNRSNTPCPARPCSTALVTTSVSASAKAESHTHSAAPKRPVVACARVGHGGDLGDELEHAVEDLIEIDLLREALSERVMHDGDGIHAAHGLRERVPCLVGMRATCLDPQQGGHRLQLFFTPGRECPDRRILGDELLLLMTQLRHIATEDDRPDPGAVVLQRNGAQRHPVPAACDIGAPRRASGRTRLPVGKAAPAEWVTSASDSPSSSSSKPIRLKAESAFGLANVVVRRRRCG